MFYSNAGPSQARILFFIVWIISKCDPHFTSNDSAKSDFTAEEKQINKLSENALSLSMNTKFILCIHFVLFFCSECFFLLPYLFSVAKTENVEKWNFNGVEVVVWSAYAVKCFCSIERERERREGRKI